jgi:hypothetical protein
LRAKTLRRRISGEDGLQRKAEWRNPLSVEAYGLLSSIRSVSVWPCGLVFSGCRSARRGSAGRGVRRLLHRTGGSERGAWCVRCWEFDSGAVGWYIGSCFGGVNLPRAEARSPEKSRKLPTPMAYLAGARRVPIRRARRDKSVVAYWF